MLTVDGRQDSSRKASVPGPVCILSLYSKTTRASKQDFYRSFLGSEQVVKGNGPLFQLFVQVILFQVSSVGSASSALPKSLNKSISKSSSFLPYLTSRSNCFVLEILGFCSSGWEVFLTLDLITVNIDRIWNQLRRHPLGASWGHFQEGLTERRCFTRG